jgi:hypothetical protein
MKDKYDKMKRMRRKQRREKMIGGGKDDAAVAAAAAAAAAAPGGVTPLQLWHWLAANEEAHAEGEGGAGLHLTRDTAFY